MFFTGSLGRPKANVTIDDNDGKALVKKSSWKDNVMDISIQKTMENIAYLKSQIAEKDAEIKRYEAELKENKTKYTKPPASTPATAAEDTEPAEAIRIYQRYNVSTRNIPKIEKCGKPTK